MVRRPSADKHELARVQRQIERWRRARAHAHVPMPPRVWAAAVALTQRHGLYRTARALRIDYGALKRHVETVGRPEPGRDCPTFIELPAAASCASRDCAIEIEGPQARLRLRVPDLPLAEIATLGRWLAGLER